MSPSNALAENLDSFFRRANPLVLKAYTKLAMIPVTESSTLQAAEMNNDFISNLRLLKAAGGLDLRRVPHLDGSSQMLGGWASEEKMLDKLQKSAEARLAKDPKASEVINYGSNSLSKAKDEDMVVDDSGEKVSEATLRAEAAALGYTNVEAWKRDYFASSLKGVKPTPHLAAHRKDPRLERRSIVTDVVSSLGHFLGSFFKASGRVQQLAGVPRPATAAAESARVAQAASAVGWDGSGRLRLATEGWQASSQLGLQGIASARSLGATPELTERQAAVGQALARTMVADIFGPPAAVEPLPPALAAQRRQAQLSATSAAAVASQQALLTQAIDGRWVWHQAVAEGSSTAGGAKMQVWGGEAAGNGRAG